MRPEMVIIPVKNPPKTHLIKSSFEAKVSNFAIMASILQVNLILVLVIKLPVLKL